MFLSRRTFLAGTLSVPAIAAKKPAPERPNLLLIMVDDLPSWVLGCYGNREIQTPNIDRLAQTGSRFINHIVSSPAAGLSRATALTGRTPMQIGDAEKPAPGDVTLDKVLSGIGYSVLSQDSSSAASTIAQQAPGKPFFLTVGCASLRAPYDGVAQKFRNLYAQTRFDTLNLDRVPAPNASAGKEMLANMIANVRKVAAAVTSLDEDVAGILSKLQQRGLLENTLIIFTATCGALLGRHGLWDAGDGSTPVNMYEESVNTPLLWSWPGRTPAQAIRPEMVSTYDLLPSICDVVDADLPAGHLCGRSYVVVATGKPLPKKEPWRKVVFGHYRNTDMARVERYKLVSRDQGKGPGELYDLVADPVEKVNQYDNPQFMSVRSSLSDPLTAWKQRYSA